MQPHNANANWFSLEKIFFSAVWTWLLWLIFFLDFLVDSCTDATDCSTRDERVDYARWAQTHTQFSVCVHFMLRSQIIIRKKNKPKKKTEKRLFDGFRANVVCWLAVDRYTHTEPRMSKPKREDQMHFLN